jgi:N-acetylmuramoyl-L-alanine amidase
MSNRRNQEILAKTIYLEARDQPTEGQKAVGHVIMNRVQEDRTEWGGNSIEGVCFKDQQFECWNGKTIDDIKIDEPDAYKKCLDVADDILKGKSKDPTGGANHYNNPTKEPNASWPNNCKKLKDIKDHRFYTDRK